MASTAATPAEIEEFLSGPLVTWVRNFQHKNSKNKNM